MTGARELLALVAWQIVQAAHGRELVIRNNAIAQGIGDAMAGKAYGNGRLVSHDKADYSLGWHAARFALFAGASYESTMGDGKQHLYWRFRASADGQAYGASYRFPPQVSVEPFPCAR